jgi:hypothetical protein
MECFDLQPLLAKLMAKKPEDRFRDTLELFSTLTDFGIAA